MGGDDAPRIVVEGAALAQAENPEIRFLFFGDEKQINPLFDAHPKLKAISEVHHTSDRIANDEKPSVALRSGKNSSMRLAIDAVADGRADCIISAGNTGALMAISMMVLKRLPGVDRPAIASIMPNAAGRGTVMLDLGANLFCTPENLVQFAVLGTVFAQEVMGVARPRVGILNVGVEQGKGREAVKEAAALLADVKLPGEFTGFVEGDDILKGEIDVVVTDGWTGNVALKTAEGTASFLTRQLKETLSGSLMAKLGVLFMIPALRKLKDKIDPRRYNGGPFMGLQGVSIKSHGGTDGFGFKHAICVGINMVHNGFNKKVVAQIESLGMPHLQAAESAIQE